jgi:uncharacterized RDD family membrane protein YckC
VRCQACGAPNRYRRSCHRCGEPLPVLALLRRLFCSDLDAADAPQVGRRPDLASSRARLLAATLDVVLMLVALFWIGALGHDPAFGSGGGPLHVLARLLSWAAILGHQVLLEGASGQTFGKRLVGIKVVMQETGGPIGYAVAAHRAGARALFWFVSFLALADPRMQTLHDRSAGTIVVNDPAPAPRTARDAERMEYETTDEP